MPETIHEWTLHEELGPCSLYAGAPGQINRNALVAIHSLVGEGPSAACRAFQQSPPEKGSVRLRGEKGRDLIGKRSDRQARPYKMIHN